MIKINGYGQRDKSWGYQDWHQFDKWYAGHFQFKNWSYTFRKDYINEKIDLSDHTSNKQGNSSISDLEIKTVNDTDKFQSPLLATYIIKDADGKVFTIKSKSIKKNSYIRFFRNFQGGYTELIEQMVIMKNVDTGVLIKF